MKTLKKIPLLALIAFAIFIGLGYGYNCIADEPINAKIIPLTPGQRDKCRAVGLNPNDVQLAIWGSEDAKHRMRAQLADELSRRMRKAFEAQDSDGMEGVANQERSANALLGKLTR